MRTESLPSDASAIEAMTVATQQGVDVRLGLSASQAQERLRRAGPNELRTQPPPPAWRHFLARFDNPLVCLLLLAVIVTLAIWGLEGRSGWPVDAIVILAIVLLNALLGFAQEARSQRAAAALSRLSAASSAVLRDGVPLRVASTELVRGDTLMLAETTLSTLDMLLPGGWIAGDQTLDTARTAAYTVLVLAQLFNAFNARSETASAIRGLFDNRWLWASAALGVGLQVAVVELPLLNTAFSTTPLSVAQWALCLAMASSVLCFGELRKSWLRRGDAARMRVAAARAQARVTAGT